MIDPAADLVLLAEAGDAEAALRLLLMAAGRTDDPDALVAYLARCVERWSPKFDTASARRAFNVAGKVRSGDTVRRAERLAEFRRLRLLGESRMAALRQVAEAGSVSVKWLEKLVDRPTRVEDMTAALLLRLGKN